MSAKVIFAILLSALAFSAVGLIMTVKNMAPQATQTTKDFVNSTLIPLLSPSPSAGLNPTPPPCIPRPSCLDAKPPCQLMPSANDQFTWCPTLTPSHLKPSPTPTESYDTDVNTNSRSCYKVTINGQTYEKCTTDGNLDFQYP